MPVCIDYNNVSAHAGAGAWYSIRFFFVGLINRWAGRIDFLYEISGAIIECLDFERFFFFKFIAGA